MGHREAFSGEQLTTWHDDMLMIPGVQRVGLEDHSFDAEKAQLNDANDPTGSWRQRYAQEPYRLFTSAVADETARAALVAYCADNIPGYQQKWGISVVRPEEWQTATSLVSARDIVDFYIRSEHLVAPAEAGHTAWRQGKLRALQDVANPYQGYGPERLKVRDLTVSQQHELGIVADAEPTADVYHPLDVPFIQLSPDMQNKNIVPMAAACLAVADFLIDDATTIEELDTLLQTVADGTDPSRQQLLNMVAHVAWAASDLSFGGRPWWAAQENYHPYTTLSAPVQDLDTQAMLPPVTYMRGTIATTNKALKTMESALKREGGPYEQWWAPEFAVLQAAKPYMNTAIHDKDRPETWGLAHIAARDYKIITERPAAAFEAVLPGVLESALNMRHLIHDSDGYWHLTEAGVNRLQILETVKKRSSSSWSTLDQYVAEYDELRSRYALAD